MSTIPSHNIYRFFKWLEYVKLVGMARHKGYGGKSNVFSQGPRTIPIHQSPGALLGRPLTHKSKEVIISAISLPEDSGFTIRSAPNAQIFGLKDLGITLSEQPRFRDAAGFLAALLSETTIDATAARNSLYGVTVTGVRDRIEYIRHARSGTLCRRSTKPQLPKVSH